MALELKEDIAFHRASWVAQRIGWIAMLLVIIAGASGLLGRGPLGERTVGSGDFSVHYDRIMRRSSPNSITVYVRHAPHPTEPLRLWATNTLVEGCQPQQIVPVPQQMIVADHGLWLTIPTIPTMDSAVVTIGCAPESIGPHVGMVGLVNGPAVTVHLWVLP